MTHQSILGLAVALSSFAGDASASARTNAMDYFPLTSSPEERLTYTSWLNNTNVHNSSSYTHHEFLPATITGSGSIDADKGAAVFWNIDIDNVDNNDNDNSSINFAIVVRAEGWVGFGISEAGGMIGSDVAIYQVSTDKLIDAHVVEDRAMPLTDDCQDWNLLSAIADDGWIILEMSRLLHTHDTQDHAIRNDADGWFPPTRLIAAWGDSDSVSYHLTNKARSSVRLYSNSKIEIGSAYEYATTVVDKLEQESDGYFDIREDGHEIASNDDTEYHEVCKTFEELDIDNLPAGQDMVTMIGASPVITDETRQFVHHFVVYLQKDCSDDDNNYNTRSMIYGWAPGDNGIIYPDDVGLPLFGTDNGKAVYIDIHYDNPTLIRGMKDSSGVRIYYTHEQRPQEAAILQLGDPFVRLGGEKINDGLTQYEFNCPGTCSTLFLGGESITVISESLHMHQSGVRMTNEVIRDGTVVNTAVVDVYDFDQQGSFNVQQNSYTIMPGDSFRTTCFYRDGSKFGLGSQEEMCIGYIMYYPAKQLMGIPFICPYHDIEALSVCKQEVGNTDLDSVEDLGRTFGQSSAQCFEPTTDEPETTTTTETSSPTTTSATKSPSNAPVSTNLTNGNNTASTMTSSPVQSPLSTSSPVQNGTPTSKPATSTEPSTPSPVRNKTPTSKPATSTEPTSVEVISEPTLYPTAYPASRADRVAIQQLFKYAAVSLILIGL